MDWVNLSSPPVGPVENLDDLVGQAKFKCALGGNTVSFYCNGKGAPIAKLLTEQPR